MTLKERSVIRSLLSSLTEICSIRPATGKSRTVQESGFSYSFTHNNMNGLRGFFHLLIGGATLIFLSGCAGTGRTVQELWSETTALPDSLAVWKKTNSYKGIEFPAGKKVVPTFQDRQVPVSCRVFAHLLVRIPAGYTGKTLARTVEAEAMKRGADMLLIGGTRQAKDNQGPAFSYYGPAQAYKCRDYWSGWKFAYDEWVEQGEWVSVGYTEWGNPDTYFPAPLVIQAAFLRCPK